MQIVRAKIVRGNYARLYMDNITVARVVRIYIYIYILSIGAYNNESGAVYRNNKIDKRPNFGIDDEHRMWGMCSLGVTNSNYDNIE